MRPNCRELCTARALLATTQKPGARVQLKDRFFACFPQRAVWTVAAPALHRVEATTAAAPNSAYANSQSETSPSTRRQDGRSPLTLEKQSKGPKETGLGDATGRTALPSAAGAEHNIGRAREPQSVDNVTLLSEAEGGAMEDLGDGSDAVTGLQQLEFCASGTNLGNNPGLFREELRAVIEAATQAEHRRSHTRDRRRRLAFTDHHLHKGPLAYDWRVPLAKLKKHTAPHLRQGSTTPRVDENLQRLQHQRQQRQLKTFRDVVDAGVVSYRSTHVDDIPDPPRWSKVKVAQHVCELVRSNVAPGKSKSLYGDDSGRGHRDAVKRRLLRVFEDAAIRPHLTRTAFHFAMRWLNENSWGKHSRQLLSIMINTGVEPSRHTFNILFSKAASAWDLQAFTLLLDKMIRHEIEPDASTWRWFLSCVESRLVRQLILDNMKALGFMREEWVIRAVAAELVRRDLVAYLASGEEVWNLLDEYDRIFGQAWLSASAANKLIHELGLQGKTAQALQVVDFMVSRGCTPDVMTLQVLIKGYRAVCNTDGVRVAMDTIRLFSTHFAVEPDASCFQTLFAMGWELRCANFCRVVWQTACLRDATTGGMAVKVMKALMCKPRVDISEQSASKFLFFYAFPAKVIAGIDIESAAVRQALHVVCRSSETDITDDERRHAAGSIRDSDRTAFTMLQLASADNSNNGGGNENFADLLLLASRTDASWLERDEYRRGDVDWMLANAVPVWVRQRTTTDGGQWATG